MKLLLLINFVISFPTTVFAPLHISESTAVAAVQRIPRNIIKSSPFRHPPASIVAKASNSIGRGAQILGASIDLLPEGPLKEVAQAAVVAELVLALNPAEIIRYIKSTPADSLKAALTPQELSAKLVKLTQEYFERLGKMDRLDASRDFLNRIGPLMNFLPEEPRRTANAAITACNLVCMARIRWFGHVPISDFSTVPIVKAN
jgi:hypothetical protein